MKIGTQIVFILSFVLSLLYAPWAYSQVEDFSKYPSRPITFINALQARATGDLAHRIIAKEAEKFLGQPIVVVNRPGGGTSIGMAAVATAKPDGYTIGHSSVSGLLLLPHLEKVPYHSTKDFRQIMQYGVYNMGVVVMANSPFKTFRDLIEYARQNPKKLTYGSLARSIHFFTIEQIAKKEGVQFTYIPFKGSPEVQAALLGGHIHFGAGDFNYSLQEAGEIKLLLLFREERSLEYPQIPILKDLGYDQAPAPWYHGLCGPKGLPDGIVKKLEDAFTKAMKEPAFFNGMKEIRIPIVYRKSDELDKYVAYYYDLFGKLVRETGIK